LRFHCTTFRAPKKYNKNVSSRLKYIQGVVMRVQNCVKSCKKHCINIHIHTRLCSVITAGDKNKDKQTKHQGQ